MSQAEINENLYNSSLAPDDQEDRTETPERQSARTKDQVPTRGSKDSSVLKDESSVHQPDQTRNSVAKKVASNAILEEDRQYATYDPFWDLKNGKSEKEVLSKLKSDNNKLRSELKSVSEDLTMLLERKKVKMNIKHTQPVKEMVNGAGSSDQQIRNELKAAEAQLERLKKEMESMKGKYETEATFERYEALKDKMHEKEIQSVTLMDKKKQNEKTLREIEKTLQVLYNVSEGNQKINSLEQDIRVEREKIRDSEKRMEGFGNQGEKRRKLEEDLQRELQAVQADIRKVQEKTNVSPSMIEIPTTKNEKIAKSNTVGPVKKKVPISKHQEEEAPPCNTENFEKLKKEIRILTEADMKKNKHHDKKIEELQEQLAKVLKVKDDADQRLAEKQKEILILTSKSKDISRIVRHHTVAPLQREEQQQQLASSNPLPSVTIENGHKGYKKGEKPAKSPPGRAAQSTYLLTEKARAKFYSKGYRKDEKGQMVPEGQGMNFNDKDIVGKNKVKIIAIDVWHTDEIICGIQAVYESDKKDVIEGGANVLNPEGVKMTTFETLEEDYVKEINGFMNKDGSAIECLLMKTYRGDSMRIGKPSNNGRFFRFDINELEHPAMLFGSIKADKEGTGKLVRLGVLISAEAVEEHIEEKKEEAKTTENVEKKDEEDNKEENDQNQSKSRVEQQTNRSKVDQEEGENENEEEEEEQEEGEEEEQEEEIEEGDQEEGEEIVEEEGEEQEDN